MNKIRYLTLFCLIGSVHAAQEPTVSTLQSGNINMETTININDPDQSGVQLGGIPSAITILQWGWELKSNLKLMSTLATIPMLYATYIIFKTNRLLNNEKKWLNWKTALSLNTLLSQPIDQTRTDLMDAIALRYKEEERELDIAHAFLAFAHDIQHESQELQRYLTVIDTLKKCQFNRVWTLNELQEQKVRDGLKKLAFLRGNAAESITRKPPQ